MEKEYLSIKEQIELLKKRGMILKQNPKFQMNEKINCI